MVVVSLWSLVVQLCTNIASMWWTCLPTERPDKDLLYFYKVAKEEEAGKSAASSFSFPPGAIDDTERLKERVV